MELSGEFCSQACKEVGVEVGGSALNPDEDFNGYILVEHFGIWEARIENQGGYLQAIADKLDTSPQSYRLQAIQPDDEYCKSDYLKVIWYRSTENPQYFDKNEFDVPENEIVSFIEELLVNPETSKYRTQNNYSQDILICVHTRRDRCCGKFGFPIYQELRADPVPNTRIWSTSHISGHRTAPTMIDLPQGRYWGYITANLVRKIQERQPLTDAELDKHYRGLVNLYSGEQLTDREALKEFGWDWTESNLRVKSKKFEKFIRATLESGDNKVTVDFSRPPKKIKVGRTRCQKVKVEEMKILEKLIN